MAFNPILETNIQPTQAVQKPSAAGAAVNLLGGLFPERAAPPTPSRADVTDSFRQETLRAMETARQAGDTAGINNAYRNWSVQQGVGTAPEIDSAFEAYTGRSPMIATTGGDNSISSIESNPSYPLYFEMARGENPDASPDDLRTAALGMTSAKMANDAKVEAIKNSQTVNWTQAQVEYDKGFNIALGELNNMITQYNADSILSPDEAKVIRDYFNTYASKFTAPMGVPAETFEQYRKTKWDAMTNLVDTQLNYILRDGSSKDMQKAMSNIIAKLTSQGRLSPMTEYAVNMGGANGDAVATILNIYKGAEENPEWTDTLQQINKMNFDELVEFSKSFEEMGPENIAAKVDTSTWVGQSDAKKIDSLTLADKAMILSTDPLQATLGIQATVEKVNSLGATSLDGDLLKRTFDTAYMSALERIKAKNPALGEYFIARTTEVLKAQQSAMLNNINTVATTNGFRAQTVNGKTEFVPDPNLMSDAAKAEVQKYFGGDWQRAWDANGLVMNPGGRGSGEVLTPALRMSFDQIKKVKGSLDQYAAVMATVDRIAGVKPEEKPQGKPVSALGTDFQVPESIAQDTEFLSAVEGSSTRLQIQPDWLLRVIDFETASTWSPQIKNPGSTATGLIQFLESTAKGLGTSTDELRSMTRGQQMAYVEKYLEPYKGRLNNFGDVYMAVHWPAGIGKDEGYVMYREGSDEYKVNRNLDSNGDGTVTRGETLARVLGATGRGTAVPYASHDVGTAATGPYVPSASSSPVETVGASPSPVPVVQGTSYQPTQPVAPEVTPQVSNSNPAASTPAANPVVQDKSIQEFIEGLKKGRQEFASMEEMQAALAAGSIKVDDIVFVDGRPVIVK